MVAASSVREVAIRPPEALGAFTAIVPVPIIVALAMSGKIDRTIAVASVLVGALTIGSVRTGETGAGSLEALHVGAAVESIGAPAATPVHSAGDADSLHTLQPPAAANLV